MVTPKPPYAKPLYSKPHKVNLHEISLHDFMISLTDNVNDSEEEVVEEIDTEDIATSEPLNEQLLIQAVKSAKPSTPKVATPGDVRKSLSQSKSRTGNIHNIVYNIKSYDTSHSSSLVDRGANGGIAGQDVRIIERLHRCVDIQGIDNH